MLLSCRQAVIIAQVRKGMSFSDKTSLFWIMGSLINQQHIFIQIIIITVTITIQLRDQLFGNDNCLLHRGLFCLLYTCRPWLIPPRHGIHIFGCREEQVTTRKKVTNGKQLREALEYYVCQSTNSNGKIGLVRQTCNEVTDSVRR